jgi:hypothetical protein
MRRQIGAHSQTEAAGPDLDLDLKTVGGAIDVHGNNSPVHVSLNSANGKIHFEQSVGRYRRRYRERGSRGRGSAAPSPKTQIFKSRPWRARCTCAH